MKYFSCAIVQKVFGKRADPTNFLNSKFFVMTYIVRDEIWKGMPGKGEKREITCKLNLDETRPGCLSLPQTWNNYLLNSQILGETLPVWKKSARHWFSDPMPLLNLLFCFIICRVNQRHVLSPAFHLYCSLK